MTKRKHRSTKERARLFKLFGGKCYLCDGQIDGTKEAWEIEHVIPLAQGGEDEDHNLQLAHAKCHKAKTVEDVGNIAKAKRREAKHTGAKVPAGRIPSPPRAPKKPSRPSLPPRELYKKAS
jgi:5-methylcytosine-specific restriction endonuclease McrA